MGYLFFFENKRNNRKLCIDGKNVPCPCHPSLPTTFGRKINHSKKHPNLKPRLNYRSDGTTPVLLFVAIEDLPVGTELKYDYGVTNRSFRGEGAADACLYGTGSRMTSRSGSTVDIPGDAMSFFIAVHSLDSTIKFKWDYCNIRAEWLSLAFLEMQCIYCSAQDDCHANQFDAVYGLSNDRLVPKA